VPSGVRVGECAFWNRKRKGFKAEIITIYRGNRRIRFILGDEEEENKAEILSQSEAKTERKG